MAKDVNQLHPVLQAKIKQLQKECKKAGLKIGIGECYRTVAEQDALYAKGRTASGTIVTNAKGSSFSSMHQWKVAVDFYRNDGKGAYNNDDKFFQKVGAIGKKIGLEWGGSWKSIVDLPHFQLPYWGSTTTKLKSLYSNPNRFWDSWLNVGDKVTCTKSVYFRKAPNGDIVKYADISDKNKDKYTKTSDGLAKFNVGSTFVIKGITTTDDGRVWGKTSSGFYFALFSNDTFNFKK